MKLQYKIQQYQSDAVAAVVNCFDGQPKQESESYIREQETATQGELLDNAFRNAPVTLDEEALLENINKVQERQRLPLSMALNKADDIPINLDIEMETGTGKTYCYTKIIFELNQKYGWTKFIIIVPSVAIREGVYFSVKSTEEHFKGQYGKTLSVFLYNSDRPNDLRDFESSDDLTVMIMNYQAFAAPPNPNKTSTKAQRKIYGTPDGFNSRRPIDIIASARPILILDEPQRLEGNRTVEALPLFKPLMALRYSATHRTSHDRIYRLDAVDAFQQKLVKKIEAVGVEVKGLSGSNPYLFLEGIDISRSDPTARIDMQIKRQSGEVKRQVRRIKYGDDLHIKSNQLDAYKGFTVDEINYTTGTVSFENGEVLHLHQVTNDPTESELRRLQIRQAVESHFEKEQQLFDKKIKVLTLFFIDEVVKYRDYDQEDDKGAYARLFEDEYQNILAQIMETLPDDSAYQQYLNNITAEETNRGYFSIDKKTKRLIDPKKGEGDEKNTSDYDLILRNKERLLSFEEKTRFIFSHSALREGWDNPNVFVISLLKNPGGTEISRRQELGRGLRISVNSEGERTDTNDALIHQINTLTVVANESFKDYSEGLQKEIVESLSGRQRKVDVAFFTGQKVYAEEGNERRLTIDDATLIHRHFIRKNFISDNDEILPLFREAHKAGTLEPLSGHLTPFSQAIFDLAGSILSEEQIPQAKDGRKTKSNPLKERNYKTEAFRNIWKRINHKSLYEVEFDDNNLVTDCIAALDERLIISDPHYVITKGQQNTDATPDELSAGGAFTADTSQRIAAGFHQSSIDYNLIKKVADEVDLNRQSVADIFDGLSTDKFTLFSANPEQFIGQVIAILKTTKASLLVNEITYSKTGEKFDSKIFTAEISRQSFTQYVHQGTKHIYDYVVAESEVEQQLARNMDEDDSVIVYAKMPRGFYIPTPFGKYNPDWAICFDREKIKHIYFMAETKGTTDPSNLKAIEKAKTDCAKAFFKTVNEAINEDKVKYEIITTMDDLIAAAELTSQ